MSVKIIGSELPKTCSECELCIKYYYGDNDWWDTCALDIDYGWLPNPNTKKLINCRLEEIK